MNIRDLEYFAAVAEAGHFGRAAEKCFVSQPTLSGQLRKLEEELGVALFERNAKGARLTAAGETLLTHARGILDQSRRLAEAARALRDPRSGPLHVGVIPTLAPYLMPLVVPFTRKLHPKLEMFLSEMRTRDLLRALADGQIEAGLLALPFDQSGMESETILTEPFFLAVPAGHALARKTALRLEDLEGLSLYLLEEGHCLKDQALEVCSAAGAREYSHFRGTSLETLRQMIGTGNGMTLMPGLAVRSAVAPSGTVRYIPFREPSPNRKIALAWRKGSARAAFLSGWAKELEKHLGARAAEAFRPESA